MTPNPTVQNLFSPAPGTLVSEHFDPLVEGPGVRIERILSLGHATPEGTWYDQTLDEWVGVLQGRAVLEIEGAPAPQALKPGDWLLLPRGVRHRVLETAPEEITVWLAVHGCFTAAVK